jgi:hypothetical protein
VDAFYRELKLKNPTARRLRCLGHVINLAAKAFLFGKEEGSFDFDLTKMRFAERQALELLVFWHQGPRRDGNEIRGTLPIPQQKRYVPTNDGRACNRPVRSRLVLNSGLERIDTFGFDLTSSFLIYSRKLRTAPSLALHPTTPLWRFYLEEIDGRSNPRRSQSL